MTFVDMRLLKKGCKVSFFRKWMVVLHRQGGMHIIDRGELIASSFKFIQIFVANQNA